MQGNFGPGNGGSGLVVVWGDHAISSACQVSPWSTHLLIVPVQDLFAQVSIYCYPGRGLWANGCCQEARGNSFQHRCLNWNTEIVLSTFKLFDTHDPLFWLGYFAEASAVCEKTRNDSHHGDTWSGNSYIRMHLICHNLTWCTGDCSLHGSYCRLGQWQPTASGIDYTSTCHKWKVIPTKILRLLKIRDSFT